MPNRATEIQRTQMLAELLNQCLRGHAINSVRAIDCHEDIPATPMLRIEVITSTHRYLLDVDPVSYVSSPKTSR